MKARVFTLPLGGDGVFDDAPLRAFFEDHDALMVSEHFFIHDGTPTLALVVQYRDVVAHGSGVEARADVRRGGRRRDESPVEVLPEHQLLMDALRSWRNTRARKDGKPAYVLFTNAQLAAIATARPMSRAQLESVDGVGEARVRDYADEVLELVAAIGAATQGGPGAADATAGA